jgi:phosphinothricin acetyltransferase
MSLEIRNAAPHDAEAICRLYNPHVRGTIVTFEEKEVSAEEMGARIVQISAAFPWLVAERSGKVIAYAYASKFQERSGYRYAVSSTIYVDEECRRQGVGTAAYSALLTRLRASPARTALAIIAFPIPRVSGCTRSAATRKLAISIASDSSSGAG